MGDKSGIEWTDATWNPVTGCDKVSPGCDNCYALTQAGRLKKMGMAKYQNDGDSRTSGPGFGLTCHPDVLDQPIRWQRPRRVFVNSMSDLFHEDVPVEFIQDVLQVMRDTPRHTYQVLTKRSRRMAQLDDELEWPPNAWVGVSVESERYLFRLEHLRAVSANVRWISAEPLLAPLGEFGLEGIDWVVVGGESGIGARTMEEEWVTEIRDLCGAAGVPFFFKQWGGRSAKANGRVLEGQTWDEYPVVEGGIEAS